MPKRIVTMLLAFSTFLSMCGCASFLDGEQLSISIHEEQTSDPESSSEITEVSTYFQLQDAILNLIENGEKSGLIRFYSYEGDVVDDVEQVCREIPETNPLGAYAVYYLSNNVNWIVSYYEAEISVNYKRTKDQIDDIVSATSLSSIKLKLSSLLREYEDYIAIYTNISDITESDLTDYIEYLYYNDPRSIVMLPEVKVEIYPDTGVERILEITFEFPFSRSTLSAIEEETSLAAEQIAESVSGVGDGEILLSLSEQLAETTTYDEEIAQNGDYFDQQTAYSAYGALVDGSAVGEGYAMAYKLLCDILGIKCYVVLGKYNDINHAWNLVELDGDYYHVDVSMCDVNGISTAFLLNDDTIGEEYSWDTEYYEASDGSLTYADFADS